MERPTDTGTGPQDAASILEDARRRIADGDHEEAIRLLEPIRAVPEVETEVLSLLAVIAIRLRNYAYAIPLLRSLEERPDASADIPEILAVLYSLVGDLKEALFYAKLATVKKLDRRLLPLLGPVFPSFADAFLRIQERPLVALGERAMDEGLLDQALDRLRQHVTLFSRDEAGLDALTRALMAKGEFREAVDCLRSLRPLVPTKALYASRLGEALTACGEHEQARICHRLALALDAADAAPRLAYLRDLAYVEDAGSESVRSLRRDLAALLHAEPRRRPPAPRTADAPLRVGYLVGALPGAAEATLVAEVMRHHDRSRVAVVGIGLGNIAWERNQTFQMRCDRWLDVRGVDKHTLAAMVRGEAIDVLVDACGLWWPEAQAVLPLCPAPVQIAWLGSPFGATAPGVGFHLAGGPAPATADGLVAWPLAHGVLAFPWPAQALPSVSAAEANGYISFGVDAPPAEISADAAMLWSRVLIATPEARLLLRDFGLRHPDSAQRLQGLFGDLGVAHRVEVVTAASRAGFLREVDVVLAPVPHASPFAAAEALALGRPVIARDGGEDAGRDLALLLRATAMDARMLGAGDDAYVAKALDWARDGGARQAFRAEADARFSSLPVYDVGALARELETAYHGMWAAAAER